MTTAKTRQKILSTFLSLLAERSYRDVTLDMLAEKSDVSLSALREAYGSKVDLLSEFAQTIDKAVLDDRDTDMGDQPARDRLFDVLMTRLDKLASYKPAVTAVLCAAKADPGLALELNGIAIKSQRWMLVAAGIEFSGMRGRFVAQGLAVSFARVLQTWLEEEDPGMPRTMARLDKELDRGEDWLERLDQAEKVACKVGRFGQRVVRGGKKFRSRVKRAATSRGTTSAPEADVPEASAG